MNNMADGSLSFKNIEEGCEESEGIEFFLTVI
jgi:hypothetical protein